MKIKIFLFSYLVLAISTTYALDIQTPEFVDMMMYSKPPSRNMYSISHVYPVGWSKNGHFAFIRKDEVAGRGGVEFSYTIINTITDGVVWDYVDDWPNTNDVSIKQSIERTREKFAEHLSKYQIIQNAGIELHTFPLKWDNYEFSPKIEIIKKKDKHPFLGDMQSVSIFMNKNTKKKKILYKKEPGAFSYWISGYFISPFENRILVVVGEEKWGFEGTVGGFVILGCSLTVGYK